MAENKEVQVNKEVADSYDLAYKPSTAIIHFPVAKTSYDLATITVEQVENLIKKGVKYFIPKKVTDTPKANK